MHGKGTSGSREEVLRAEINRVRAAADDLRERYRAQYNAPVNNYDSLRRTTSTSKRPTPR
jgi:hypothetical protein